MTLYRFFVIAFIVSILALIGFFVSYIPVLRELLSIISDAEMNEVQPRPDEIINLFLTPSFIISVLVLGLAGLVYRIIGIVIVARNPNIESGEKVLWILGFVFLSFITAIVFMALKNQKDLLATTKTTTHTDFGSR